MPQKHKNTKGQRMYQKSFHTIFLVLRVSQKTAPSFYLKTFDLRPVGPGCRNATEPGAARLRRPPACGGTAPAKVAYAATVFFWRFSLFFCPN